MQETDKNRILNFLIGKEKINDFESWVYNDLDLESRIGSELYLELIGINYQDKSVLYNLNRIIRGNYVSHSDFEKFKYKSILQDSGWYKNRQIEINLSRIQMTPEIKNAVTIIEEFGGLKFISPEKRENWTLTLVEFLDSPGEIQNMKEYGLNKNLVCFAMAHNDHINLFVDENNKYYQLDNVVSENLYEYKGLNFEHMMKQILQLEKDDNFHKIENPQIEILRNKRKKIWDDIQKKQQLTAVSRNGSIIAKFMYFFRKKYYLSRKN